LEVRKVQRLGSSSLIITLPKSWVNKVGIKAGDSVYIIEREKELRIIAFENEEVYAVVEFEKNQLIEEIKNKAKCLMYAGIPYFILKSNELITDDIAREVMSVKDENKDYEIKKVDSFSISFKLVSKMTDEDIDAILRESLISFEGTINKLLESLTSFNEKSFDELKKVKEAFELRASNIKHFFNIGDLSAEDPILEKKAKLKMTIYYSIYNILRNLLDTLLVLIEIGEEDISKNEVEYFKNIFGLYLSLIWEVAGAITNESLKRIEYANKLFTNISNNISEFLANGSLSSLSLKMASAIVYSLSYVKTVINDSTCYIHLKDAHINI
jgi:phosphate uptake regulator